ncbi:hypothetical protein QJS66_19080 [Kocuria rhizophila]|nr:hypothetical protein QJS66_19080 [Kocuria rhizophila]
MSFAAGGSADGPRRTRTPAPPAGTGRPPTSGWASFVGLARPEWLARKWTSTGPAGCSPPARAPGWRPGAHCRATSGSPWPN